MCGLAGWFDTGAAHAPPEPECRRAALDALSIRGPDGEGEWAAADGRSGLLHRRLAIVDVEHGAQPMRGPRDGQMLAWNGEVFEHRAIRADLVRDGRELRTQSDTEVLAHLLAGEGAAALNGLRAQFAIAWVSGDSLVLARDIAGEKPLYWTERDGRVSFASTLDALCALDPTPRDVDGEALSLYLSWGFIPAPRTIRSGIWKLRAGEVLTFRRGSAEPARTSVTPPPPVERDGDDVEQLRDALSAAARHRFESSDVPVGVFLSGGLDSAAVAAVLRDAPNLRTFTVRSRDARLDESADAARVAAALGVRHDIIEPPADDPHAWRDVLLRYGEPFGSTSALAVDAVARAASEHVKVVLTGDGGDEALGGYPRHIWLRRLARLPTLPGWTAPSEGPVLRSVRRAARLLALPPAHRFAEMYEVFGAVRARLTPGDDGWAARELIAAEWSGADAGDLDAMLRVDRRFELADSHCAKVDVACLAHGVESRSPWLDRDVVSVCDALPPARRMRRGATKLVLRDFLRRELPSDVAEHVLTRPKRGFTTGFDDALAATGVRDLLLSGTLDRIPGLDASVVPELLDQHGAGRGNHRFRLAVLVALALFADARL